MTRQEAMIKFLEGEKIRHSSQPKYCYAKYYTGILLKDYNGNPWEIKNWALFCSDDKKYDEGWEIHKDEKEILIEKVLGLIKEYGWTENISEEDKIKILKYMEM
jgi:hypothetical protein